MNNFTKEELVDLNIVMAVWVNRYPGDTKTCQLQDKLQSMIDEFPDDEMVFISKERLEDLVGSELKLIALENCGVDSWEGYEDAMDCYRQSLEE